MGHKTDRQTLHYAKVSGTHLQEAIAVYDEHKASEVIQLNEFQHLKNVVKLGEAGLKTSVNDESSSDVVESVLPET